MENYVVLVERDFNGRAFPRVGKMAAMRRALTILKCFPAVLCGLLIVAWAWTQGGWAQFVSEEFVIALQHGSVTGYWQESERTTFFWESRKEWWFDDAPQLGRLMAAKPHGSTGSWFPIPLLCTLILPLAIGPFISFRFRLWHYFAFTALVAVELAYYLKA